MSNNSPWAHKREALRKYSSYRLNNEILSELSWGRENHKITKRLAELVSERWPGPGTDVCDIKLVAMLLSTVGWKLEWNIR